MRYLILFLLWFNSAYAYEILENTPSYVISLDGDTMYFNGDFQHRSSTQIMRYANYHKIKTLVLESNGGFIAEGYQLGYWLESHPDVGVRVDRLCVSTCAYAALGAPERLELNGMMALHRPYIPGFRIIDSLEEITAASGQAYSSMMVYLAKIGYNLSLPEIIVRNTSVDKYLVFTNTNDLLLFKNGESVPLIKRHVYWEKMNFMEESEMYNVLTKPN